MDSRRKVRDDRWYVRAFWRAFRRSLDWRKGIAIIATIGIAALLIHQNVDARGRVWGVSPAVWMAVTGSMLASGVFVLLQWVLSGADDAAQSVYREKYEEFVELQGIRHVFAQRGGEDVLRVYKRLMRRAEQRIWAIGQTNKHFSHQHPPALVKALDKKGMDVVIAFWNPKSELLTPSHSLKSRCIVGVQAAIEGTPGTNEGWRDEIGKRQQQLANAFRSSASAKGTWRIASISCVTNFTCLILDDDVFFFPFLSGPDSTNNPTIHCSATHGIGKAVLEHVGKLLADPDFCCVFDANGA